MLPLGNIIAMSNYAKSLPLNPHKDLSWNEWAVLYSIKTKSHKYLPKVARVTIWRIKQRLIQKGYLPNDR